MSKIKVKQKKNQITQFVNIEDYFFLSNIKLTECINIKD